MKMRRLSPSLREKKRYVVFEVVSQATPTFYDVKAAVEQSFLSLYGTSTVAQAGLSFLPETWRQQKGILRVSHKYVDHVKASFAFVQTVQDQSVVISTKTVSGILRKAKEVIGS